MENKKTTEVARQNSNISEMWETGSQPAKNEWHQWGPVRCHRHTDFWKSIVLFMKPLTRSVPACTYTVGWSDILKN